jgi:two-component system sensor histidine kinase KdpD
MPAETESNRPSPEALLAVAKRENRGKLKVFLGAAPGVGKSFAMLEAAHRRQAEHVDVVVGLVETHGRMETGALLSGLEVLAPKTVEYRERTLTEFDLDSALARKPQLILVDELAHTNAPGSRHPKRWHDVAELLANGIDVYTTLNIQHLESVNDIVAQITHVKVRETLPDSVLEQADDIELVDLPSEELLKRLHEGKIYAGEQARRAAEGFFKAGNLAALRELALRRTAERVDAEMVDYMQRHGIAGPWPAGERILVCVSPQPDPVRLVRAGRRLADQVRAQWSAVYIETPRHMRLSDAERDRIAAALRLAEFLGGEARTIPGSDIIEELLQLARKENVTQIVLGKIRRARWREFLLPSLVHELLRRTKGVAIHVVPPDPEEKVRARVRWPTVDWDTEKWPRYAWGLGASVVAGFVAYGLDTFLDLSALSLVFLIPVLYSAVTHGLLPSVFTSIVSMLIYNFFFLPPLYTFTIADPENILALIAFLVVAILTSNLAGRVRDQARAARRNYGTAVALYEFSRKLAATRALDDLLWATAHQIATMLSAKVVILLPEDGQLSIRVGYPPDDSLPPGDMAAANWAFDKKEPAGRGSTTLPNAERYYVPARTAAGVMAVVGVVPDRTMDPEAQRLLDALVDQAAVGIERVQLGDQMAEAHILQESEKLRTALLSSISHDLRTPLSSIIGSVTSLLDYGGGLNDRGRRDLLQTIQEEAQRLNRFVANLLDMTKLKSGALELKREWTDLGDVIGSAIARARPQLKDRPIEVSVERAMPLLRLDHILFEQVLFNLLDNAAKYGPPTKPVRVSARRNGESVIISVVDHGPGIPTADLERVFDKFHRVRAGDRVVAGTGLGLSICRGIVEAHGGTIRARSPVTEGLGTEVEVRLPIEAQPATPMTAAAS